MPRVFITGMGVWAPGARNVAQFSELLAQGRSAIRKVEGPPGDWWGGVVDGQGLSDGLSRAELANYDLNALYALRAAEQALQDAGPLDEEARRETGVYTGCGGGGTVGLEENFRGLERGQDPRSTALVRAMASSAAAHLSLRWGLQGPSLTYSVACTSSALAIGEAFRAIQSGRLQRALAGGSESTLSEGVLKCWSAMRVMARSQGGEPPACRPFCASRDGLLLGEGAAFYLLESEAAVSARGGRVHAELLGFGTGSDASHLTAPNPQGQARVLAQALRDAGLRPSDIGYVNAHGTGTHNGDQSEAQALNLLFGEALARLPVSSIKGAIGHLIGAAGAVELLATVLALRDGLIAPTLNHRQPDSQCPLDCVPNQARHLPGLRYAMSNSFAFGGSNACLVLGRAG